MKAMILVSVDKESLKVLGDYIIKILCSTAADAVKCAALDVLRTGANANTTISNCNLTNKAGTK
jgi:hypothetical protein